MSRSRISFSKNVAFEEPTINLTPLIDVVFVILIMFILIAPLLELDRVELADGPIASLTSIRSVQEASPVTVHVHRDNTIWFNSRPVTPAELKSLLVSAKAEFPDAHPQIFHDKTAQFGVYQTVKNAVEEAGFANMDLIVKPA